MIETASGRTYEDYLRANIFVPAGMTSTFLERPRELVRYRSRQYIAGPTPFTFINAPYVDLSVKWAGGGLIATAGDIARFVIALDQGRLLKPETQQQMFVSGRLNNGWATGYGLGWMVSQDGARMLVAHSGGAMGGTTYLLRDPKAHTAAVVLANIDNVPRLRDFALQLLDARSPLLPVSTR